MIGLPDMGLAAIVAAVKSRDILPGDIVRRLTERIHARDEELHAFISLDLEGALRTCAELEMQLDRGGEGGLLFGAPFAIKDNIDVALLESTSGSRCVTPPVAPGDASVVKLLRRQGAIILGKSNLNEWAIGATGQNPHYGTTKNPCDVTRLSGGSSGGSAAAVAAGFAPGALGTDTGGSIRVPAALCGVSGLRPTTGTISCKGIHPFSKSLDTVGPIARTVADVALIQQVLSSGRSGADRLPSREELLIDAPLADLRVGYVSEIAESTATAVSAATLEASMAMLRLGATVEEASLPMFNEAHETAGLLALAEAWLVHRDAVRARPDAVSPDVLARLTLGSAVTATEYAQARRFQTIWSKVVMNQMSTFDVLLLPTTSSTAPPITAAHDITSMDLLRLTYPFSFAGLPALTLPCGRDEGGLPIGMQLVGHAFGENNLFRVGSYYQARTNWHSTQYRSSTQAFMGSS
ncbi:MAG: amidase [Nitrospiraceae bacterium]|nr:amidase [Nitrospiraceae bacterium]